MVHIHQQDPRFAGEEAGEMRRKGRWCDFPL